MSASLADLKPVIERAFDERDQVNSATKGEVREAVEEALNALDKGEARVAEKFPNTSGGEWVVHQWLKMAVLLSFRLNDMSPIPGGPGKDTNWKAGARPNSARRASAPCRTAWCAAPPISRPMWC